MIRIYLILLLLILVFFGLRVFIKTPPATVSKIIKILLASIAVGLLIYLTATGRMNWLFALFGVVIAFLSRLIPVLLRLIPHLHQYWSEYLSVKKARTGQSRPSGANTGMSIEEAYEVLGLKTGATAQEIIAAHRRLIQKAHPDHGGSNYLATKINLAKKILLDIK